MGESQKLCVHQRGTKKYIEIYFMGISKKSLYYQYCRSAGVSKILSISRSWVGQNNKNLEHFFINFKLL